MGEGQVARGPCKLCCVALQIVLRHVTLHYVQILLCYVASFVALCCKLYCTTLWLCCVTLRTLLWCIMLQLCCVMLRTLLCCTTNFVVLCVSFIALHCKFCCTSNFTDPSSNDLHTHKQWLIRVRSHIQKQKWTRRNSTPTKTRCTKPLKPHRALAPWKTCEQTREHQKSWVKAWHCSLERILPCVLFCQS